MSIRRCLPCVEECKDQGDLCAPNDADSRELMREEPWMKEAQGDHRKTKHAMSIQGAQWVCDKGHQKEASGYEVMEHAGTPRLI